MKRLCASLLLACLLLTLAACHKSPTVDNLSDVDTSFVETPVTSDVSDDENADDPSDEVQPTDPQNDADVTQAPAAAQATVKATAGQTTVKAAPGQTTAKGSTAKAATTKKRVTARPRRTTPVPTTTTTKAPATTAAPTTVPTAAPKTYSSGKALKIACVGDSITNNGYWKNNLQNTMPSLHTVSGFGVNGATALLDGVDGGSRIPRAYMDQSEYRKSLNFAPDVVVIMLGTNDSKELNWYSRPTATFIADYVTLVKSYQALPTEPAVFIALPPMVFGENPAANINNENIESDIIPALYEVSTLTGARVIDTHTATKGHAADFNDGVHPSTNTGRLVIAQAVSNAIKAIIK